MNRISKSAKKSFKSNTFGKQNNPFLFTDFQRHQENHTYYDDPLELAKMPPKIVEDDVSRNKANLSGKDLETQDRDKQEGCKSDTQSFMQDEYHKNYPTSERKFLIILSNTKMVYDYVLYEEYLLEILKENELGEYMEEYIQLLENNHIDFHKTIIELGNSSLKRFLENHEKRVFEFPPQENEQLMVVRNGE